MAVLKLLLLIASLTQPGAAAEPAAPAPQASPTVIVVIGAAGTPEYGAQFAAWSDRWKAAAQKAAATLVLIGARDAADENGEDENEDDAQENEKGKGAEQSNENSDRDALKAALAKLADKSDSPVWLVLIGHGTFDGQVAKLNLRGPDVTPSELAEWLKPVNRRLAVVDCTSASAPLPQAACRAKSHCDHGHAERQRAELRPFRRLHVGGDRRPFSRPR